jgi:hypothetical protein
VTLPLERRIAERRRELRLPFPEPEPLEPHDAIRPPDR